MQEYYVLNQDPQVISVFKFITAHDLPHELHLNRTRFWVPPGLVHTEFVLRFAQICPCVESS
jgi:hypothetical protein